MSANSRRHMSIIGAGVGGLTTALALTHRGFDVDVYEATKQIRPISTGTVLSPVALNILDEYCVLEDILAQGQAVHTFTTRTHRGKRLSRYDVTRFNDDPSPVAVYKRKIHSVAINTSVLQNILMSALKPGTVHVNKCLSGIDSERGKLRFGMGDHAEFDCLIGADGLNSVVRGYVVDKERLRDQNQVTWRGTAKTSLFYDEQTELVEYWGNGLRFTYVQMSDKEVYWYATQAARKDDFSKASLMELDDLFSDFPDTCRDILYHTGEHGVLQTDVYELSPLASWYKDNMVLMGDAAHAMTPNIGQGGCQAIEDAWALAECLDFHRNEALHVAFDDYQRRRKLRVTTIANMSRTVGQKIHQRGVMSTAFRNLRAQLTSQRTVFEQMDYVNLDVR